MQGLAKGKMHHQIQFQPRSQESQSKSSLELIYKVNLKSSAFFAYQGFQAPETVLSGFPESLVLREFQRLNKSALILPYF
jgi:hypothetical protein